MLLKAFSINEPELSLTELTNRLGLNRSTTFRLLATLQGEGYVQRDRESGKYSLGVVCLELGTIFLSTIHLREQALPLLEDLRRECGETVHLAILDKESMEVVYLEKLEGLLPIAYMGSRVGGRSPAYCTGLGKVLLAYEDSTEVESFYARQGLHPHTPSTIVETSKLMTELEEIKKNGFGIDNEEHESGVNCVAAPIWNENGRVTAAISISGPTERMNRAITEGNSVQKVMVMAAEISARLGGSSPRR